MALVTFEDYPSTNTPLNATNLNNNFNECNNIVESGSNSNGRYIKFSDGTMVCYKTIHKTNVDMSNQWGALYETVSAVEFGDFPQTFIEKPCVSVTKTDGAGIMHEGIGSITTTSAGSTYFCSPINRSSINFYVDIIAIGRWK